MKKFIALMLLSAFAVASCYAAPTHRDVGFHQFEYTKKHCDLTVVVVTAPVEFALPTVAPIAVNTPLVQNYIASSSVIVPHNKGPDRC